MNFTTIVLACATFSVLASAGSAAAQDRMPPIPADKMTDAQKKAAEELVAGQRGELIGPFIPLLRSPEFMSRLQKTGAYLRYENVLGRKLTEFIILLTARQWTQQFEWDAHFQLALKAMDRTQVVVVMRMGTFAYVEPRSSVGSEPSSV